MHLHLSHFHFLVVAIQMETVRLGFCSVVLVCRYFFPLVFASSLQVLSLVLELGPASCLA